jgi:hypothetical protein
MRSALYFPHTTIDNTNEIKRDPPTQCWGVENSTFLMIDQRRAPSSRGASRKGWRPLPWSRSRRAGFARNKVARCSQSPSLDYTFNGPPTDRTYV